MQNKVQRGVSALLQVDMGNPGLKEIETRYPVAEIRVNSEQVWPYLRSRYYSAYRRRLASQHGERQSYIPPLARLGLLPASLYGARSWLKQYDYVCLSSAGYRRKTGGTWFNRFIDPIIDELGADGALMIEAPFPRHVTRAQVHSKHVVSSAGLTLAARGMAAILRCSIPLENASVLESIAKDYGIAVPHKRHIRIFQAERRIYRLVFRRLRPRAFLLTCYYGREAAIAAAHDLGIQVIEVQHGVIGKAHPAYNVYTELDKYCFPDHLLVFGSNELDTFDNPRFIDPKNVYPVGSFYIDHIRATHKPDSGLTERLRQYKRTVGVTLQLGSERRLLDFVCSAAKLDKEILYVIIPRRIDDSLSGLQLPENLTVIQSHNFYETMLYVDFHATLTSTCALEAPSLGVQNILIDLEGMATRCYGAVLTDDRVTRYVQSPEELVQTATTFERLDKETVCKMNERIISPNYVEHIQDYVRTHLPR